LSVASNPADRPELGVGLWNVDGIPLTTGNYPMKKAKTHLTV
jgi:hypothetical protein